MRPIILSALLSTLGLPALADTPLGINAAEFRLGAVAQDTGTAMGSLGSIKDTSAVQPTLGFAAVNVAITQHHGLQGDALFEGTPDGAIGRLGAHLFMTPRDGQKYGLFATLADLDGEALTWISLGAEGILDAGRHSTVELRGGIGAASAKGLDWIFLGGRISRDVAGGAATAYVDYNLTEFDEPGFDVLAHELSIGTDARLSRRLGAFASVSRSRLSGSSAPDETTLRAGITIRFGKMGRARAHEQMFTTTDPVAQLIRRGYF